MADKTDPGVYQQPGDRERKMYQSTEETQNKKMKFVEDRKRIFEPENKTLQAPAKKKIAVEQRNSKDIAPVHEQDTIDRCDKNNDEGNISDSKTSENIHGELYTGNDPNTYLGSRDCVNMHTGLRIKEHSGAQSGDDGNDYYNNFEEEETTTKTSADKTVDSQQDGKHDGQGSGKNSDIEVLDYESEEERRDQDYVFLSIPSQSIEKHESYKGDSQKSPSSTGITTQNNCNDFGTKPKKQMGKSESNKQRGSMSINCDEMSLEDVDDEEDNDYDDDDNGDDVGRKDLLEQLPKTPIKPVPQVRMSLEKSIRFVLELANTEILEGKDVTLKCQLSKSAPVTWTKNGSPLEGSEHAVFKKEDTSHQLHIPKVKLEDAGTYAVHLGEISSSCTITVKEEPMRFVLDLANTEILEGKDVTLKCQLSKLAPVTWTKDGSPLEESKHAVLHTEDTSHQLHIPKVRMEDAGTYAVHTGEISSSCKLTVKEKSIRFVLELANTEILEGKDVTLKCQLSKSAPVTWTKNGSPLEGSEHAVFKKEDTSHQLHIPKVKLEDAGTYAVHLGEISSSCTITVKEEPMRFVLDLANTEILEGKDVTLKCQLSKLAPVTWTKDGSPLEESKHAVLHTEDTSHQLHIPKVRMEDAGTYAVHTGEISSSCKLTVKEKSIRFVLELANTEILEGKDVTLKCQLSKSAPVTWTKNGSPLEGSEHAVFKKEDTSHQLHIPKVKLEHAGTYAVHLGEISSSCTITVKEEPMRFVLDLANTEILEGKDVTLKCQLSKSAPVTWTKDGSPLEESKHAVLHTEDTSHQLHIPKVRMEDAGTYAVHTGEISSSCKLTVKEKSIRFVLELANTEILEGKDVTLKCQLSKSAPVTWTKNGSPLEGSEHAVFKKEDTSHQLHIPKVKLEDAGTYAVHLGEISSSCTITVKEEPMRFVLELANTEILEGKDVTLKCQLSKSAPVTWTKDGSPLEESKHAVLHTEDTSHQLHIPKVRMKDAGTYAVHTGEISSSCKLTVKEKSIRFVLELANTEILEGKDVTLKCQLSKSAPVTWTKNGSPLEASEHAVLQTEDTSHQLHIPNVKLEDAGTYAVHIEKISSSCTLTVKEEQIRFVLGLKNSKILEGKDVTLKCQLSKSAHVTWTKNGFPLEESENAVFKTEDTSHQLHIPKVKLEDAGTYAVNIEKISSSCTLTVKEKPIRFVLELANSEILEGKDVTLKCQLSKSASVTWTKNGSPFEESENAVFKTEDTSHQLHISNVKLEDAGTYAVHIGEISSSCTLTVKEKPIRFVLDLANTEVLEGKDVTLKCQLSKSAPVTWTKNGSPLETEHAVLQTEDTSHQLHIPKVRMEDAGTYAVHTWEISSSCTLTVKGDVDSDGKLPDENPAKSIRYKKRYELHHFNKDWFISKCGGERQEIENFSNVSDAKLMDGIVYADGKYYNIIEMDDGEIGLEPVRKVKVKDKSSTLCDAKANTEVPIVNVFSFYSPGSPEMSTSDKKEFNLPLVSSELDKREELDSGFKFQMKVIFTIKGVEETEEYNRSCELNDFMALQYVCKDNSMFKINSDICRRQLSCTVLSDGKSLVLNLGLLKQRPNIDSYWDSIIQHMLKGTENLEFKCVENTEGLETKLSGTDMAKNCAFVTYVDTKSNMIYLIFNSSISKQVDKCVNECLNSLCCKPKTGTQRTKLKWIFWVVLSDQGVIKYAEEKWPLTSIRYKNIDMTDEVLVNIDGTQADIAEITLWLQSIESAHGVCSISLNNMPDIPLFAGKYCLVNEFLNSKFKNMEGVKFAVNETTKKVWILSSNSQSDADKLGDDLSRNIKNNDIGIWERFTYPLEIDELTKKEIEEAVQTHIKKHKGNVQMKIEDRNILVSGVTEGVQDVMKIINDVSVKHKSMNHSSSEEQGFLESQFTTDTITIENQFFLNYLLKPCVFGKLLKETNVTVLKQEGICFSLQGLQENLKRFRKEIKELQERIVEIEVDVDLDNSETASNLDQWSHKYEISDEQHVIINRRKEWLCLKGTDAGLTKDDVLQETWTFCQGKHELVCAELNISMCRSDIVLKPYNKDKESEKEGHAQKQGEISIPVVGKYQLKRNQEDAVNKALKLASDTNVELICIDILYTQECRDLGYLKQMLCNVFKWIENGFESLSSKTIILCCSSKTVYEKCIEVCQNGVPKRNWQHVPNTRGKFAESNFQLHVCKGNLVDTKTDVIVNTTNSQLNLSRGGISEIILRKAGSEIQKQLNQLCPEDLPFGQIVTTDAFNISSCKHVIHGALQEYKQDDPIQIRQMLHKFVFDCLLEADSLQQHSIAFPAVGTGNLGYPKQMVANTMFEATKLFFDKYLGFTSLDTVTFVIYQKDVETQKAFEKEEIVQRCQNSEMTIGSIAMRLNSGPISTISKDCLIYLWDKNDMFSAKVDAHELLAAAGRDVAKEFIQHRQNKDIRYKNLPTTGGNIPVQMILHVPCEYTASEILEKTVVALREANFVNTVKSVCIGFGKSHPFLQKSDVKLVKTIVEAVLNFMTTACKLSEIDLLISASASCFEQSLTSFELCSSSTKKKASLQQQHSTVRVKISGMEDDVAKAVDELRKSFSVVKERMIQKDYESILVADSNEQNAASISPPPKQEMERHEFPSESNDQDGGKGVVAESIWNKDVLEPWAELKCCIRVRPLPNKLTQETTKTALSDWKPQGVDTTWKMHIDPSENSAMIFFQNPSEADKFLKENSIKGYQLSKCEKNVLARFQYQVGEDDVQILRKRNKLQHFKDQMRSCNIQCIQEDPMILKAPTSDQMKYAINTLHTLTSLSLDDPFMNVEKNISKSQWELIENAINTGQLNFIHLPVYDENTATITTEMSGNVDEIRAFVAKFKDKELQEIVVADEHVKLAKSFSHEIGSDSCIFIEDKNKMIIVTNKYDEFLEIKHKYVLKTGGKKPTARSKRLVDLNTTENNASGEPTSTCTDQVAGLAQSFRHNSGIQGRNAKTYSFSGDIVVYAYEADILKLNVDCIVNAANKKLQHGGGVAAAIQRGAGKSLKNESDAYVSQNGPLEVGKACYTTAGNLHYTCVVHTVGPAWQDYYPYSWENVKKCEEDLYNAIYNSFLCAEETGVRSIALPAISSAIFGVPEDLCVYQYALATKEYCLKAHNRSSTLSEIHFVDLNGSIVDKIQLAFDSLLKGKSSYERKRFVKTHSPKQFASTNMNKSIRYKGSTFESAAVEIKLPEPKIVEDNEHSQLTVLLAGERGMQKLIISQDDIFKISASSIVVSVSETSRCGILAQKLLKKISYEQTRKRYTDVLYSKAYKTREGDVFLTEGFGTGYSKIIHVVIPITHSETVITTVFSGVFDELVRHNIDSVATTLIGIDQLSREPVRKCCDAFLQAYVLHCKKTLGDNSSLRVHLVCKEWIAFDEASTFFKKYVLDQSTEAQETNTQIEDEEAVSALYDHVDDNGDCVICIDTFKNPVQLKCGHIYCQTCIDEQFKHRKACPTCGQVLGIITGNQPKGKMTYIKTGHHCVGYESYGSIVITYTFPDGKQKENHPTPGKFYKGITRKAYLPDNKDGNDVLKMLDVAFKRKLVFTIGKSRTTGEEGVITWNDIHHKTDPRPYGQFGYPDPEYLSRVKDELSVKGVTVKDIK